jgi:hypothetical protein
VALTELREGLVGSPLQSAVEVVTPSRGKLSHHDRVGGMRWNVHMDLAAPQPELMVRAAMVRGKPRVAKATRPRVRWENRAVHPIAMEPSVSSEGDVGVVVYLSKTREKQITFHQSNRDNKPKLQINHDDNKTLTQILFLLMTISQNSAD